MLTPVSTEASAENWGQIPIDVTGITNPAPEIVYQSERWGTNFSYTFSNLTVGAAYYVRLHFSEHNWTNVGQRPLPCGNQWGSGVD